MLFRKDENTEQITAVLLKDGNPETWECIFIACPNPVCNCRSLEIVLTSLNGETHPDKILYEHRVKVDLAEKKVETTAKNQEAPEDLEFSKFFQDQLNDDDFEFMFEEYFNLKHEITETADPNSLDADFDFDEIETQGSLYGYNEILPYGDMMQVNLNDEDHIILDQYCLIPKCPCTDIILQILPADKITQDLENWYVLNLDYGKKHWEMEKTPPNPMSLNAIRSEIEKQNPGFYRIAKERHNKLKKIYLNNRQKKYSKTQPVRSAKTGRNDPCPCGSGKKYKKCCG